MQHVACTESWSQQTVSWVWQKWEILCLERDLNPGIPDQCATITPRRLLDVTTILMPTSAHGSLPQRSVQTTALAWNAVGIGLIPALCSIFPPFYFTPYTGFRNQDPAQAMPSMVVEPVLLVTVCTHAEHYSTRRPGHQHHDLISHSVTLSWHKANQSLPCSNNECQASG